MKALSISQPWAAVIAAGLKTIENRPWKPAAEMIGATFAIHAAKSFDADADDTLDDVLGEGWRGVPHLHVKGAIIGTARLASVIEASNDPFFFGPFGFVLDEVRALVEPVAARGFLGFWDVPADQLAVIRSRMK